MDYLQTLIAFVTGNMSFRDFYNRVMSDDLFSQWIDQNVPGEWKCYTKATPENHYTPDELPFSIRYLFQEYARDGAVDSIGNRFNVHSDMIRLLNHLCPENTVKPDSSIEALYDLLSCACPSYIDGVEVWSSGILEGFAAECPAEWTKSKRQKFVKARIIEAFHLEDKKYPRWLQNPEWPFYNGKPMKYSRTSVKQKNEWYQHHFYDPQTGEERIVDDMT